MAHMSVLCILTVFLLRQAASSYPAATGITVDAGSATAVCRDLVDCNAYLPSVCVGVYAPFSKANCARFCGYCQDPAAPPRQCRDTIPTCHKYGPELCTKEEYRVFVEENCVKYCGKCDFRPRYVIALEEAVAAGS